MRRVTVFAFALAAGALMAGASVLAQPTATPMIPNGGLPSYPAPEPPAMPPPGAATIMHDPAATEAGTYTLDSRHVALFGKISHNMSSWSVFRLDKVTGTLDWNPAHPELSKLSITVDPASIKAADPTFSEELSDKYFLNAAKFPTATFVSTSAKATGPGKGQLTGNLMFMGVTRPMTFDVVMTGASKGARGSALGFNARGYFDRTQHGWADIPAVGNIVRLEMDVEFDKAAPKPAS